MPSPAVLWFRRDFRLHDHPALNAALEGGRAVAPLFVLDKGLLRGPWPSPNRVWFMLESLRELDAALRARGNRLHIRTGPPEQAVRDFALEARATDVYVTRDYTPYARRRDHHVSSALSHKGIILHARAGLLIVEPESTAKEDGSSQIVYTPFRKRWELVPRRPLLPAPVSIPAVEGLDPGTLPDAAALGFPPPARGVLPPGEAAARERLERWADGSALPAYGADRDQLGIDGTSRLSQDLRWGLLSPLEVEARTASDAHGPTKYVHELAWREFYYHVLWHSPRVTREPFQRKYAALQFDEDEALLAAWKAGQTGYPIVDAAMRQLQQTGWVHNRARMIVASFLTKDLLLDYRLGERHFMEHLTDGDIPSNNGGWQWTASTGTDPQPYFRIFNPISQGKKFDPEGTFVRQYVPELANLPTEAIHEPWTLPPLALAESGVTLGVTYPHRIVDHHAARERALERYRSV
jgi:deoxyribodipyrimidine photo-lyase